MLQTIGRQLKTLFFTLLFLFPAFPAMAAGVSGFTAATPAFTITNNDTGEASAVDPAASTAASPMIMTSDGTVFSIEVPDGYAYNLSSSAGSFPEPLTITTGYGTDVLTGSPLLSADFNTNTGEVALSAEGAFNELFTPSSDTSGLSEGYFSAYSITGSASGSTGNSPLLLVPKTGGIRLEAADLKNVTVEAVDGAGSAVTSYLIPGGSSVSLLADAAAPSLTEVDSATLDANTASPSGENPYDYDEGEEDYDTYDTYDEDLETYDTYDEDRDLVEENIADFGSFYTDLVSSLMPLLLGGALFSLVFYLLQAFALFTMSKNSGIGTPWFGFIPFLNNYLIGQLIGNRLWGFGGTALILAIGPLVTGALSGVLSVVSVLASGIAGGILGVVFIIYSLSAVYKLFKIYDPKHAALWLIGSILTGNIAESIGLFLLRNKPRQDGQGPSSPSGGGDPGQKDFSGFAPQSAQTPADGAWSAPQGQDPWASQESATASAPASDPWAAPRNPSQDPWVSPSDSSPAGELRGSAKEAADELWKSDPAPASPSDPWSSAKADTDGGDDPWGNLQ